MSIYFSSCNLHPAIKQTLKINLSRTIFTHKPSKNWFIFSTIRQSSFLLKHFEILSTKFITDNFKFGSSAEDFKTGFKCFSIWLYVHKIEWFLHIIRIASCTSLLVGLPKKGFILLKLHRREKSVNDFLFINNF